MISGRIFDPVFTGVANAQDMNTMRVEHVNDDVRPERQDPDRPVQAFPERRRLRKERQPVDRLPKTRRVGVSLPYAKAFDTLAIEGSNVGARSFGEPEVGHSGGAGARNRLRARFGEYLVHRHVADA